MIFYIIKIQKDAESVKLVELLVLISLKHNDVQTNKTQRYTFLCNFQNFLILIC